MGKQKIVVKVSMNGDKKTRKALQVAVSISRVDSASLVGSNKDRIAVTGEHMVELTRLLRKRVGYTELLQCWSGESKPAEAPLQLHPYQHYYGVPYYHVYHN